MTNAQFPGMALVRSFLLRHEGELALGALEARGLHAILNSDDCGSVDPALGLATGGARLYVAEDELEAACSILEEEFPDDAS